VPHGAEPGGAGIGRGEEGAFAVDELQARGDDGGGGMEIEGAQAGLDALGLVEVVGVEDADEIAIGGEGDGAVEGGVSAGVRLREDGYAGIGDRTGGIEGAIRRTVVNDEDAVRRAGLRKQAPKRIADIALVIKKRDDDG
jgi:hypothetical protein